MSVSLAIICYEMTEVVKRSQHERGASLAAALSRGGEVIADALRKREFSDAPSTPVSETPWDLIGQARRLTMLLHDIHAFSPETGPSIDRLAEARRLHKSLLAHGQDETAEMIAAAVDQF